MPDLDSGLRIAEGNPGLKLHLGIAGRNADPKGSIVLYNGRMRLDVVPEASARITSLVRIETGRDFPQDLTQRPSQ
jgi:hypothetical protein